MSSSSFLQSNYENVKEGFIVGLAYTQEYTKSMLRVLETKILEYKVKEIFHPYNYVSQFWECASAFLDTPVKQALAMQIVLTTVFGILLSISRMFSL